MPRSSASTSSTRVITPQRRWASKRWPNTSTSASGCPGCSSTIPPAFDAAPRPRGARGCPAARGGAGVQRVGRRAGPGGALGSGRGGDGVAHDLRAAGLRRWGARVGGAHTERPLVRTAVDRRVRRDRGARDRRRGGRAHGGRGDHVPVADGGGARGCLSAGHEARGGLVPRGARLGDRSARGRTHGGVGAAAPAALVRAGRTVAGGGPGRPGGGAGRGPGPAPTGKAHA